MGAAVTKLKGYKSLNEELDRLTVEGALELVQRSASGFFDANTATCGLDTLVNEAIAQCSANVAGAIPILDANLTIVAVLDLPLVLDYLLALFSDATDRTKVVETSDGIDWRDDFSELDGPHFGRFVVTREASFVTPYAPGVMERGTRFFDTDTVRDLLQRTQRHARADVAHAVPLTLPVRDLLQHWLNGRNSSVCVFRPDSNLEQVSFGFLNELDALHLVEELLRRHEMDLAQVSIKRLGLGDRQPVMVTQGSRVMHCFKEMSDRCISALPIVADADANKPELDDQHRVLVGEFSLHSMRNLSHEALQLVLGNIYHFLLKTDPQNRWRGVLTCSRRDTLHDVLRQMHVARRMHVWCVSKQRRVKGVVSLTDVMGLLFKHTAEK